MPILPLASLAVALFAAPVSGYDFNHQWSAEGIVAGSVQCQRLNNNDGKPDTCRGALPVRPSLSFTPTTADTFHVGFGFAAGNGLNKKSPFQLSPWGADLHDDVKDINGRGRDYLLNAWYRHAFQLAADNVFSVTAGIIDSVDYLDGNVYANDAYTQFMNEALVNSTQIFLPSYDRGAALQWDNGLWSLRAVFMNVGKDDDNGEDDQNSQQPAKLTDRDLGDDYNFLGVEIGYTLHSALGEGNYRLVWSRTSRDFVDPSGSSAERRGALALSFDQQLGDSLGAFVRVDIQADQAAIDYEYLYSGGIELRGKQWGRPRDNIGLGIAYLHGGNQDIDNTRVAEVYYRLVLHRHLALSADLQTMRDDKKSGKNQAEGFIFGLRVDLHF